MKAVVREIEQMGYEALPFCSDARSSSDVESMISSVCDKWGKINVLINNAAITRDNILPQVIHDDWEETFATNLTGAFNTIRGVADFIYGLMLMKNVPGQVFNLDSRIS